ncbi:MAG: prepilin-type N-terminal cleavage/methylation domain-containing protein [Planctomycetes bacterium]|nr:prepilin-type N-terminal cleavage/methylation domain-containing protein [Planctomycetota bacterium]
MRKREQGFTLIELLVVIAIIALLISILLPSLSRARELSKRLVCMSNIKGIGTSFKIYANDNNESYPIPPFDRSLLFDDRMVMYTEEEYNREGETFPGQVGMDRFWQSFSVNPNASTQVSVTRAFWMLVRSGDVTVKQFVCPSSGNEADQTESLELYYDFTEYGNVSYGYQVPFGPRDTTPREGMDNRQGVAADKGPFYTETDVPTWQGGKDGLLSGKDSPKAWRRYNSGNHGGAGTGEGQNILFADGHANFARLPIVGIDKDNIYTYIDNQWSSIEHVNLIHGLIPAKEDPSPFPGQFALGSELTDYAATDTLIYP